MLDNRKRDRRVHDTEQARIHAALFVLIQMIISHLKVFFFSEKTQDYKNFKKS